MGVAALHQNKARCYSSSQRFFRGESLESLGEKLRRLGRGNAPSRAVAGLVLLVLMAHAFVAGTTHFHGFSRPEANPTRAALLGSEEGGQSAPLANDDAQCLLCRLQRNSASGVQQALAPVGPLPAEALRYDRLRDVHPRAACSLLNSGRAPPLA